MNWAKKCWLMAQMHINYNYGNRITRRNCFRWRARCGNNIRKYNVLLKQGSYQIMSMTIIKIFRLLEAKNKRRLWNV